MGNKKYNTEGCKELISLLPNFLINFKKSAFTLAEVLITLAIVGIIAAMTIPTLVQKYEERVLISKFRKSYSTINQALLLAKSKFDYLPMCYYDTSIHSHTRDCRLFMSEFLSALKIYKTCTNHAYQNGCIPEYEGMDTVANDVYADMSVPEGYDDIGAYQSRGCTNFRKQAILNDRTVYVLSDGTIILTYSGAFPLFAVDVNGMQGPNKWGYDLFSFMISSNSNYFKIIGGGCSLSEKGGVATNVMIKKALN